jgi:glycine hydroxymethyltransferase
MSEIASIMKLVLTNTSPAASSKVNYTLPESVHAEARARIGGLLARYPVYPELDLEFLEDYFTSPQRPA